VEVAIRDMVSVRDSKHPDPILRFSRVQWGVLLEAAKRGEFDR
jgi:hypothetical protein